MRLALTFLSCVLLGSLSSAEAAMTFEAGPVNGVLIERDGHRLAVYGWAGRGAVKVERVLLTHGRRDVVWKAESVINAGAKVMAPNRERASLEQPQTFWRGFRTTRFHDYGQQTTKVIGQPIAVDRWVKQGDVVDFHGLKLHVIETPGFTRGSVSYLAKIEDETVAFTGDLIYGDGQILDLYSFQDAIPEAQIRGYHGYGSRLASLVSSLQKIAEAKPDKIVPARGPIIDNPQAAITTLIDRVRRLYHNYLSTNALHWYFKEDRMKTCGARVLGKNADVQLMPYSHHETTPSYVFEQGTSRLLISKARRGFLLDCGSQRVIDAIDDLIAKKIIDKVDGIFVTHYHDDHTNSVQDAAEHFGCPVYATREYSDVLEKPRAYHLPAMTDKAIKNVQVVTDGQKMKWQEFQFTFYFYPGQTYFHGAMLVKRERDKPIFFIGDAFAPSGIDDYCVQNRNLLHDDQGYLYCLKKLRSFDEPSWLVNEHIRHVFSFSEDELNYLEKQYRARIAVLKELLPWDDPNYGIDDRWAVFYPHGSTMMSGKSSHATLEITNHSPRARKFKCDFHHPAGWQTDKSSAEISIPSHKVGEIKLELTAGQEAGVFLITADIHSDGLQFKRWSEAVVTVTNEQ